MVVKTALGALVLIFTIAIEPAANCFHIDNFYSGRLGYGFQKKESISNLCFFSSSENFEDARVVTEPKALLSIIKDTLSYFNAHRATAHYYPKRGILCHDKVKKTLEFVAKTIEEDIPAGAFRILDPEFIQENFKMLKWNTETQEMLQEKEGSNAIKNNGKIRLTHYAIFRAKGSYKKTKNHPYALYSLRDAAIKKKYTKQQILAGAFEKKENKNKVKPLTWLSRKDLEEALMQGTVAVEMPDKKTLVFSLNCDNGIPYKKNIKNPYNQKRYWFFHHKRTPGVPQSRVVKKITERAHVVFAGDIEAFGVGKLIAIKYKDPVSKRKSLRIGVLADAGGAFSNNRHQLDLFTGLFPSKRHFIQHFRKEPRFAEAFILYRPT